MAKEMTTKAEIVIAAERKPLEIKPDAVTIDAAGQAWRTALVRMPEGSTQDDLRNPKIWSRVQGSRQHALLKLDHLLVLGFDESWFARAVVVHASSTEVHLVIEKVGSFKEQGQSFYSDGTLEVFWDGAAYGVRRCADGVRIIVEGFTVEDQAISALRSWYPKKAG